MNAAAQSPLRLGPAVARALAKKQPVVAIESSVFVQGLPAPHGELAAADLGRVIENAGAVMAICGVFRGRPTLGLTLDEVAALVADPTTAKVTLADLGCTTACGLNGATTVATCVLLAALAGIRVVATGGIGGVHRGAQATLDISADLTALAQHAIVVVCSGPKTLVDAPLTLQWLETHGVPVLGYQTAHLPLFYQAESDIDLAHRVDSAEEVAAVARCHWSLGLSTAVVVAVPAPASEAIPASELEPAVQSALRQADEAGISGPALTPFVLARIRALLGSRALAANLALLRRNSELAAQIAVALAHQSAPI